MLRRSWRGSHEEEYATADIFLAPNEAEMRMRQQCGRLLWWPRHRPCQFWIFHVVKVFFFIVVVAISIFSTLLNCVHACFCPSFAELFISHCGIHFSEIKGYLLYFGIACAFCVNIFMQSNLASLNNIDILPISHEVYFLGSHRISGKDFSTVNCNDFNPWIHGGYIWFI